MPHTAAQTPLANTFYPIGAWRNRQTRRPQEPVGMARAGSSPAAPT